MTAVGMWVRADLRRRWRSWVVLGILAGISMGLACAGIAGARRTDRAIPRYERGGPVPDAAVLANDPAFDDAKRAELAALPEVEAVHPFALAFELRFSDPEGLESGLLPTEPESLAALMSPLVDGRAPAADRPDEIVVNEKVRDDFGLDIGSTMTIAQEPVDSNDAALRLAPGRGREFEQQMRVVGITDSPSGGEYDTVPSSAFYDKYRDQLVSVTNAFVDLRGDAAALDRFRADVDRVMGRPTNVESGVDLYGVRQIKRVAGVEAAGLLLFALAVLVGAGALVGQALVRAVSAGAADLRTLRAIGVDRRLAVRAMVVPAALVAAVGVATTIVVGVLLSPRFPIAHTRRFELDIGYHADWAVFALAAAGLVAAVVSTSWVTAELRLRSGSARERPTRRWFRVSSPAALVIGSRLATDTGRGNRAVPVRSAMVGAIVGVLGVVGCLTFRSGLSDTVSDPSRSGVVWDHFVGTLGLMPQQDIETANEDPAVDASLHATWARAVPINGKSTPAFGTAPSKGDIDLVVLAGRGPGSADELALAPTTMDALDLDLGDRVIVGDSGRRTVVVGRALLPATPHTAYDQGAWMTAEGLTASLPPEQDVGSEFFNDFLLLKWKPGTDRQAAQERIGALGDGEYWSEPAVLSDAVEALRALRVLPLALAFFFALLAIATVAHALVTTVRRRRTDLAILRSLGFTRRESRFAIAWQATILATVGVVVGVPAGILVGRLVWKQLADDFPVVYVPPVALLAVLLVAPAAIAIANALAAGPAHAATRVRPANALRAE